MDRNLPHIVSRRQSGSKQQFSAEKALWVRLVAFLSTRAPNTQSTYIGIIKEWCEFLGSSYGSPDAAERMLAATDLHAISYRNWLERRPGEKPRALRKESTSSASRDLQSGLYKRINVKKSGLENTQSNATIAKKFAALRRMYRALIAADIGITQNPFDSDRAPAPAKESGRKRPTEMVDFSFVRKILALPNKNTPKGQRDAAILAALFGGGLRRSEICALHLGDVRKSSAGTMYLYLRATKAKKDAEQALPKWAAEEIERWCEIRTQQQAAGAADFLFISFSGKGGQIPCPEPISPSGVYKLFKMYCKLSGAGGCLSPHSARATAITRLLDSGIAHREVQQFSRHSSIQMVELYDKRRLTVDQSPAKELDYDMGAAVKKKR